MTDTTTPPRAGFSSFEDSTREDWALIMAQRGELERGLPDRILEQFGHLRDDYGGFPVDRLEHSLQTATRAERDGRDDEYVLCALVHDIGDPLTPYNHPDVAAAILKPFVSEANHWMVEKHGIFQGYYFWHHLGMDRNTRDMFAGHEFYDRTEEFCAEYDGPAFDPSYDSNPLDHYLPLIREVFGTSPWKPEPPGQAP
ncbi:MAG: HD domain-containing protein [Acidimicrobiales bacterium]|mgnify:CR=1 FL=1|nr:HD domain-containing protein [Acidimicrobiales bacterium]